MTGRRRHEPLEALIRLARELGWRVGITGMMDGVCLEGQALGALEIREQPEEDGPAFRGWYELELVATYPLTGRSADGATIDVPLFVAAAGLLEVLSERAGGDEIL